MVFRFLVIWGQGMLAGGSYNVSFIPDDCLTPEESLKKSLQVAREEKAHPNFSLKTFIVVPPNDSKLFFSTAFFVLFLLPKVSALHCETGSKLMLVVYKGIAPGDERQSLPLLDINSKRLAESLLHLAFAFGVQVGARPC